MLNCLALRANDDDRFVVYLRPGAAVPDPIRDRSAFSIRRLEGGGVLKYGLRLPRAVRAEDVQLLNVTMHSPPLSPVPVALMLPDLSFVHHPEFFRPATRVRLAALVPWHARQARAVMTLSEFSRRDIIETYLVPEEKVFVVTIAIPARAAPVQDRARRRSWLAEHGIGEPFFLYLGNLQPRKNLPRLIAAFARARGASPALAQHRLVVAGEHWAWGGARERLAELAPRGSVVFLGRVSDDERDTLLRETVAFAYLSIFEGFGLPPLEALAAGAPVVASRTTAMPEVLGDAALLVDPFDVDVIAAALVRVATDEALRVELQRRGPERAARYDAHTMGDQVLRAFNFAISSRGAAGRSIRARGPE